MNKMRYVLFVIICALVGISAFGKIAKQRIGFLKEHLVYPKYENGDTVYVWLQTMVDKPIGYMPGIEIKKYTVVDIALTNGGVYKHDYSLSLSCLLENADKGLYLLQYKYQLLPCAVKQIVGNIYPILIAENRVLLDYNSCQEAAKNNKEE